MLVWSPSALKSACAKCKTRSLDVVSTITMTNDMPVFTPDESPRAKLGADEVSACCQHSFHMVAVAPLTFGGKLCPIFEPSKLIAVVAD